MTRGRYEKQASVSGDVVRRRERSDRMTFESDQRWLEAVGPPLGQVAAEAPAHTRRLLPLHLVHDHASVSERVDTADVIRVEMGEHDGVDLARLESNDAEPGRDLVGGSELEAREAEERMPARKPARSCSASCLTRVE